MQSKLPCEQLKAELARLRQEHGRWEGEGEMTAAWRDGVLCLLVEFEDGMLWCVPFDPEAQGILESQTATKH